MDSQRQEKISRLIQKELSELIQHKSIEFLRTLISVTVVRVSPDLSVAKVYLSIFPVAKKDEVFALIKENSKILRHELSQKTKNQLRKVPELIFYIDDSLDYADKIDNLLKE